MQFGASEHVQYIICVMIKLAGEAIRERPGSREISMDIDLESVGYLERSKSELNIQSKNHRVTARA